MVRDSLIVSGNTEQHIQIVTPSIGIVQAVVAYLKCDNCRVRDIDPRRLYVNDDPTSTVTGSLPDSDESVRSPSSFIALNSVAPSQPLASDLERDHSERNSPSLNDEQRVTTEASSSSSSSSSSLYRFLTRLEPHNECDSDLIAHFVPHGYFPGITGFVFLHVNRLPILR